MNLHTDVPTRAQIDRLLLSRDPCSVSIYLRTEPASSGQAESIELKDLAAQAVRQLRDTSAPKSDVDEVEGELADLADDDEFWRYQARSLAAFATPAGMTTFRLANRLVSQVEVADRFYVTPLLRSVTFPQVAYVLALAQGSVRLIEVTPDLANDVRLSDLPSDVASAVRKASIKDRSPSGRLQGSEGQKVQMRTYARRVDEALRPFLSGRDVPLILAVAPPLDTIFRSVNTYPFLVAETIAGNPENVSSAELAEAGRQVLDGLYAAELARLHELFGSRDREGRASRDIGEIGRAATFGAVETTFVDIDELVPGSIDEETGVVSVADVNDAVAYGVVDEIARRVWLTGGRVVAVRREDIPGNGHVAAILRFTL